MEAFLSQNLLWIVLAVAGLFVFSRMRGGQRGSRSSARVELGLRRSRVLLRVTGNPHQVRGRAAILCLGATGPAPAESAPTWLLISESLQDPGAVLRGTRATLFENRLHGEN